MRHLLTTLALLATSATPSAYGQPVYKCGNTYSQQPCAPDAKPIDLKVSDGCELEKNHYRDDCFKKRWDARDKESAAREKQATENRAAAKKADEDNKSRLQRQIDDYSPLREPDPVKLARNHDACKSAIRAKLKDPESAKFDPLIRANKGGVFLEVSSILGTTFQDMRAGVLYSTMVNAKNSYGGYTGQKLASCIFDLAEEKILFVTGL